MDVYSNRILVEFNTVGVRPMPGSISEEEFLRQLGRLMRNGGTLTADDSTLLGNPK
jgi:hypothetical protein